MSRSHARNLEFLHNEDQHRQRKAKGLLFLFVLSLIILISGARLVSSDEVSMYLTVESIVDRGSFDIPYENTPGTTVFNGKIYAWYEAGNILAGIPFYILGKAAAAVLPVPDSLKFLLPKAAVSLTNAFVGAWIAVLFLSLCLKFGAPLRLSIVMTLVLIFSTFLLPYFKLYLREPLLTLCLLGGFYFLTPDHRNGRSTSSLIAAGSFIGFGMLTKLVFAMNFLPLLYYLAWDGRGEMRTTRREKFKQVLIFSMPVFLIGLVGTGLYNVVRMGNHLNTGYTGGTAFTTPLYVGIYGLLLSPGKGLIWFAPILMLLIAAIRFFRLTNIRETNCIIGLFLLNLGLYSMYVVWAGDGSWGPRYLAPLVPLLVLPIVAYIRHAAHAIQRAALVLAIAGGLVQLGGTAIYAGAYLREIGEFPYQRSFDDPEFLYKAHFVPNYSPVIGHWRMLWRNLTEHLGSEYPRLQFSNQQTGQRIPLAEKNQDKLLHTLDFWFTYALYAGISSTLIGGAFMVLLLASGVSGFFLYRTLHPTPQGKGVALV